MKINWKVRVRSWAFWVGLVGVIFSPILAYLGLEASDLNTWASLGEMFFEFVNNPYLIGTVLMAVLGFLGVLTDPTTEGIGDSELAQTYEAPRSDDVLIDEQTVKTIESLQHTSTGGDDE